MAATVSSVPGSPTNHFTQYGAANILHLREKVYSVRDNMMISWDNRGSADEATTYFMLRLAEFAKALTSSGDLTMRPDSPISQQLYALFRRHDVYFGLCRVKRLLPSQQWELSPLQIQTDWMFRERPGQSDKRLRFLCLTRKGEGLKVVPHQFGEVEVDVVALFDVRIESLEAFQRDRSLGTPYVLCTLSPNARSKDVTGSLDITKTIAEILPLRFRSLNGPGYLRSEWVS